MAAGGLLNPRCAAGGSSARAASVSRPHLLDLLCAIRETLLTQRWKIIHPALDECLTFLARPTLNLFLSRICIVDPIEFLVEDEFDGLAFARVVATSAGRVLVHTMLKISG